MPGSVYTQISISLDGYVAGPDQRPEAPLGTGGDRLHEWAFRLSAWRRQHGLEGGEEGPETPWVEEIAERTGAYVMGRRMFSGGEGPWESDANAGGWWGDEPPFHAPVLVVTSHERAPLELRGGTTFSFVTGGVAAAVEQARAAAGGRDVQVAGGGSTVRQALAAGLLDELVLHIAPVLLGGGVRLFEDAAPAALELVETVASPFATHVRYRL